MNSLAFVFPGQGSQFVGMGQALSKAYPEARELYAEADKVLGFSLAALCFDGPEAALADTLNTQPAILASSIAALRVIQSRVGAWQPACVAGHSLGEFSALVCAGVLAFKDALKLVRERGCLMKQAGEQFPGGMAAVIKLERSTLATICREAAEATNSVVQIANDNAPGQMVISGDKQALEKAMELAKARGAKRCIPLAVSIAAHSTLMAEAAREFRKALDATPFAAPAIPVIGNVQAGPLDAAGLRDELEAQLTSPVRWVESVEYMVGQGVTTFVEVGPKDVLCGLIKRISDKATTRSVGDPDQVAALQAM